MGGRVDCHSSVAIVLFPFALPVLLNMDSIPCRFRLLACIPNPLGNLFILNNNVFHNVPVCCMSILIPQGTRT